MIKFSKSTTTKGTIKGIATNGDVFMDDETGELIDLAAILYSVYGDRAIDISTSMKFDDEVTPELGGDTSD